MFRFTVDDLSKTLVEDLRMQCRQRQVQSPFRLVKVHGMKDEDVSRLGDFLTGGTELVNPRHRLSQYWTPDELIRDIIHVVAVPHSCKPSILMSSVYAKCLL
jgi:hypothetical protein